MLSITLTFLFPLLFISTITAVIHTIPVSTTPTTTTTSKAAIGGDAGTEIEPLVDRIEAIDVSGTQVIIITSKVGPAERAKVQIDVIDLATGEKLPSMNLAGILLVISRGRYTINFLKPNRWYGIAFRCEQQPLGPSGPIYIDTEEHLVKTHREDGTNMDGEPIVTIFTKRFGTEGKSMENLVLTLRWEQHPDERTNLNTMANVTLYCEDQVKFKQIILDHREVEKSVEVKLDNNFEVMELHNNTRQIIASISPKHCPKICWNAELYADAYGHHFQRDVANECEDIETVTAHAILRDYRSYEMRHDALTVHTNYTDGRNDHSEKDAYVQLTAIALPEHNHTHGKDVGNVRYKVFETTAQQDSYTLDGLEAGRLYAVQYTYGKQSPFAYAESRRFIVETRPTEDAQHHHGVVRQPVQLHFHRPASLKAATLSPNRNADEPRPTAVSKPNDTKEDKPWVSVRLDPTFLDYRVGMDVEPFCRDKNGSHFWLSANKPEVALRQLDVVAAVCSSYPEHTFCKQHRELEAAKENDTFASTHDICIPNLCYTASVVVRDKVYSMERRCVNVANQFPAATPHRDSGSMPPSLFGVVMVLVAILLQSFEFRI